jgi:hypothetical protein
MDWIMVLLGFAFIRPSLPKIKAKMALMKLMKRLRLPLLALMTISFVLSPTAGTAEEPRTLKALVLPLTGTGSGVTFNGTVTVQRFVQQDGEVLAIGAVVSSHINALAGVQSSMVGETSRFNINCQ